MKSYFKKLFQYTNWANQLLAEALQQNAITDEYSWKLLSHMVNAQTIWLDRIRKQESRLQVWDLHPMEQIPTLLVENGQSWLNYLETVNPDALEQVFSYTTSKGDAFHSVVSDVLTQVTNHSTYHRGQIVKTMRELGFTLPGTDYITYCRLFSIT
jgi:uncharacterized damage-inducible protein DinB